MRVNAGQVREAVRLLEGASDRDIVVLLELGGKGCLLVLGDPAARHLGWREWTIEKNGSSREMKQ